MEVKGGRRTARPFFFAKSGLNRLTQGAFFWNKREAKLARLRRQTIQVWAPGVSISVCWIAFDLSQSRNLRFMSMRWSSVPQAIQSRRSCELALESSAGKSALKSSESPPELKAPIQAKRSRVFNPVKRDSAPPRDSPATARDLRSFETR